MASVGTALFRHKVAIITGAASGIGKASALAMSREGAQVAIFDSNAELGLAAADSVLSQGGTAVFFEVNVADESSVREGVSQAMERFERIDYLLNNAGIAVRHSVVEQEEDAWQSCMDVNVKGAFLSSKHVLPHMLNKGSGSIVNMSSVTGITGVRSRSAYSAAKGAVVALTRNMAVDYAKHGIRVNCISPGFTRTPMAEALLKDAVKEQRLISMHPLGRLGEPEDIANAVVFLFSDMASWITGQVLAVDGGFSAGRTEDI